ncbi:MAG: DUF3822 family protein [Muribaculaceae bacterium]|nr:DUF3822 family protein [Muribaculaceae bacterium]MDE6320720.1 DUF3822 family protein [Muribaculaceae bacterium]
MTIEAPNIEQPRLWRLYMLITSRHLYAMLFHSADAAGLQLYTLDIDDDDNADSITRRLEETIYANEWLVNDFGRVSVIYDGSDYTVLPPAIAADTEPAEGWIRCQAGAVETLDFKIPPSLSNFVMRTWPSATIEHRVAPLSRYFYSKSRIGQAGKMYVNVSDRRTLDIIVYGRGGLRMLNTFTYTDTVDAVYFIMAARELLQLDQMTDELIIAGDRTLRDQLTETLRDLLAGVMPAIFPATLYGSNECASEAPFSLIVMPLCE